MTTLQLIIIAIIILIAEFAFSEFIQVNSTRSLYSLDMINAEKADNVDESFPVRCYGFYGCFPINEPWKCKERPYNVFPFSPSILEVKFPAFTHKTRENPQLINLNDQNTITSIEINKNHSIYFIAHGFFEAGYAQWMINMMNELLDYDNNATVVIVDWRGGSSPPYYQAVANIRLVGAIVAHTIIAISLELEIDDLDKFHLIGHSLGAHMSGYAGYYTQRDFDLKIGRITGLDPAKPYFEFTNEIIRLDTSDAKFVDIVHTDSASFTQNSFGLKQAIGHVDFYPNNGENQPACDNAPIYDVTCSHTNAIDLFTESINTQCPFNSISCTNYDNFINGSCSKCNENENFCIKFGFHSYDSYKSVFKLNLDDEDKPMISTYLKTSDKSPYCSVFSKISIKIEENRNHKGDFGKFNISIVGNEAKSEIIQLNGKPMMFKAGNIYNFYIHHSYIGNVIKSIRFLYLYEIFTLVKPYLYIEYIEIESVESGKTIRMCRSDAKMIYSSDVTEFKEIYCDIGGVDVN